MEITRVESRKLSEKKRKARLKRRVILNIVLLGLILIMTGVLSLVWNDELASNLSGLFGGSKYSAVDGSTVPSIPDGVEDSGEQHSGNIDSDNDKEGNKDNDQAASGSQDDTDSEGEQQGKDNAGNDEQTIMLSFVGDILLGPYVEGVVRNKGHEYLYEETASYLSKADFTAGNLEAPITTVDNPFPNKDYVYKASPDTLPALKASGIDIVSLANNHTMDHGVEGMRETIEYLNGHDILHMGAGESDIEAFSPLYVEANGISVAYIGVSEVIFNRSMKADKHVPGVAEAYDPKRAVAAIQAAAEQADIVVVMPHWGEMNTVVLEKQQLELGKAFIDAGADLVVGSHPHVLQGFEQYNGKWIAYSLGNFIFGVGPKGEQRDTGVLDAVCTRDGECSLQLHPMYVENAQPRPMEAEEGERLLNRLMAISPGVRFEKDGTISAE